MKSVLIVMWIVMGIIIMRTLHITNSTDCLTLLGLPFLVTLFDVFIN